MRPEEYEGEMIDPRPNPPTARELLTRVAMTPAHMMPADLLAARVEKVLAAHADGGGWACELCQTHLPCPTVRILNGDSE